jgi:glycosyltransferase involved in cell wall biosynthesis
MERGNQLLKKLFYFVFRIIFSDLISRAGDKFIAAQEDTRIIIRKAYGIKKKVDLIDQGTDTQTFRFSKSARRSMRKKFKIKNDNFVIIYVGKVIASKGIDVLFKAFRQLSKEFDDIHLLIVGGSDEKYLKKCFEILEKENKNLKKKVIVVDFQEEKQLFKYYSMSDVAVWPLQDSLSMNDAAACELVFIANDKLGAKTRISNDNALLYKRGDYKDLAERIKYLYNNPEKREMMGKRGRQLAEDVLSWSSISQKIV